MRFTPATLDGRPVEVELPYLHRFLPPPPPPPDAGPARTAKLTGHVVEKGTRRPVPAARVTARVDGADYAADADREGAFSLELPPGDATVELDVPGYRRFRSREALRKDEQLELRLLVERLAFDEYRATVHGERDRVEIARTTLTGRELHHVPGTFGDPFRVVGTLPGVGQIFSLIGYPIVRGTSPGNTGFLIDGVKVPQLFHFLGGPSVIHPEFIERVDFYPGTFPVEYGGYTGGIVDGKTRPARPGESKLEVDMDLLQSGALARGPIDALSGTGTLAGRIGYPGELLGLFSDDIDAAYWDAQARLDLGTPNDGGSIFAFGSYDELSGGATDEIELRYLFGRLDLSRRQGEPESARWELGTTLGFDQLIDSAEGDMTTYQLLPRARLSWPLAPELQLRSGVDLAGKLFTGPDTGRDVFQSWLVQAGMFADAPWRVTPRLLLTPGVRTDVWINEESEQPAIDPRLFARYTLAQDDAQTTWVKGGAGLFHQPPRFFIPIPGLEELALSQGLLASWQVSAGVEREWRDGLSVDATTYFQWMDPILFDLTFNSSSEEAQPGTTEPPATEPPPEEPPIEEGTSSGPLDLFPSRKGRGYGLELLVRQKANAELFGWISYTLSRSERLVDGVWRPFDFDRRHMLQLVAGYKLPRNWELGGRFQAQSGRPVNVEGTRRAPAFWRVDFRVDKRAVWQSWLLDFYVDVQNVTLSAESLDDSPGSAVPYVLPTIGFRAVF